LAKAQGWLFEDETRLLVAMRSKLIPSEVQGQAVSYWRTESGGIGVTPVGSTPRVMSSALKEAGVERAPLPNETTEVRLWPALLPTQQIGEIPTDPVVIFVANGETKLLELLGELVRLGCDRCSFQVLDGPEGRVSLVRAYDPPYYSVALAMDSATAHHVFVPALAGQERVWIERGRCHPALLGVLPEGDGLEFIGADNCWRALPAGTWTDAFEILDVQLPAHTGNYAAHETSERLEIPLRLARASRDEPATLWVIPKSGERLLEELLGTMPDDIIERLLFAVVSNASSGESGEPTVLLRARLGRGGPPQLALSGQGFWPLMGIGNLYVPQHHGVEPPLRRDTLRELLASEPDRVYWITERDDNELSLDSALESEFSPLSDWADYVIHQNAEVLDSWVRSSVFEFTSFQSIGREWNDEPAPKAPPKPEPAKPKKRAARAAEPEVAAAPNLAVAPKKRAASLQSADVEAAALGDDEQRLADLESEFLALDTPADDPQRIDLWRKMGAAHTALENHRDATLSWTRAVWESTGEELQALVAGWIESEEKLAGKLGSSIGKKELRLAVATYLGLTIEGKKPPKTLLDRLPTALDAHEEQLDVRTVWLARTAMSQTAGGDLLMLARARDGLLRRVRNGLSVAVDVPTFLRFAGGSGADREAVAQLAGNLESLWKHYQKTKRTRSAVEAPEKKTKALVGLQFAFGFASLGMLDRAKELRESCIADLDASDHIDQFLARAYSARIDQALAGEKRAAALPPTIAATLDALPKLDRYKIDRLRSASTILEPQERLDPMQAFQRGGDSRGEEFEGLRAEEDPGKVVVAIRGILDLSELSETSLEDRARLLDGVMDFFPLISEADAVPALRRVLTTAATTPPASRALLLEEAMSLTGFFGRDEMTREIASDLSALVNDLPADEAASLASEFGSCLRGLRRVGLAEQASQLLERLAAMTVGETPDRIEARLHVAAGQAYLGDFERARVSLVATQKALGKLKLTGKDRLGITRALAIAWSHAPREEAMKGLSEVAGQLALITDSFNTNSHFCLSVVSFMDSMVLALASGELAMGDLGRRWLDEDEYLVRRRIHQDIQESGAKR
tara:strand:- start:1011 stop:4280 length:3270 start_codon:yes stop_codon:yes gene_type:complete